MRNAFNAGSIQRNKGIETRGEFTASEQIPRASKIAFALLAYRGYKVKRPIGLDLRCIKRPRKRDDAHESARIVAYARGA
jgi:hypothetical protein